MFWARVVHPILVVHLPPTIATSSHVVALSGQSMKVSLFGAESTGVSDTVWQVQPSLYMPSPSPYLYAQAGCKLGIQSNWPSNIHQV